MTVHPYYPTTWVAEVGGLLQVLDQLGLLHSYMAIRAAPISEEEEERGSLKCMRGLMGKGTISHDILNFQN